jgi:hypothetical protein
MPLRNQSSLPTFTGTFYGRGPTQPDLANRSGWGMSHVPDRTTLHQGFAFEDEPPPMFPDDQGNLVYQQPRWTGSPMTGGSTRFNEAPASLYKPTSTHSNVAPINQSEQP